MVLQITDEIQGQNNLLKAKLRKYNRYGIYITKL